MSGGKFDYDQYKITTIADTIESELLLQGQLKDKSELAYLDEEYLRKYPEERYNYIHPEEVQKEMREGIRLLRLAAIYAQRIDWYLSGDDGPESFLRRLKKELSDES